VANREGADGGNTGKQFDVSELQGVSFEQVEGRAEDNEGELLVAGC
jgi:hypothetical protein